MLHDVLSLDDARNVFSDRRVRSCSNSDRDSSSEGKRRQVELTDAILIHQADEVGLCQERRRRRVAVLEHDGGRGELLAALEVRNDGAAPAIVRKDVEVVALEDDEDVGVAVRVDEVLDVGRLDAVAGAEALEDVDAFGGELPHGALVGKVRLALGRLDKATFSVWGCFFSR